MGLGLVHCNVFHRPNLTWSSDLVKKRLCFPGLGTQPASCLEFLRRSWISVAHGVCCEQLYSFNPGWDYSQPAKGGHREPRLFAEAGLFGPHHLGLRLGLAGAGVPGGLFDALADGVLPALVLELLLGALERA